MTPQISDPAPVRSGTSKRSSILSIPVIVILLCSVGALPPVAHRLTSLDYTLHAYNDTIVFWILAIMPFLMVGVAVVGLWLMFSGRARMYRLRRHRRPEFAVPHHAR